MLNTTLVMRSQPSMGFYSHPATLSIDATKKRLETTKVADGFFASWLVVSTNPSEKYASQNGFIFHK